MKRSVHALLTAAIHELSDVTEQLRRIAELLVEARNQQAGLDAPPNEERHREYRDET